MLSVENLSLVKNDKKILQNLSFSVFLGSALILTGKNGSGKTSFVKTLAGISKESSGKILWGGQNIEEFRADFNGDLQFLGHKNFLKTELTLIENLDFWASLSGCENALNASLKYFKIDDLANEKVKNLSAGQQKRALLAKIMAIPTTIWIFDEPTVNLDEEGKKLFVDLVKTKTENQGMVIITTHEPDLFDFAAKINIEDFK